jgi:trimeric autotransporter adhesin
MQRIPTLLRACGLLCSLTLASTMAHAQTGIGTTTPDPSSRLEVSSTTKGLLTPRMTTAQRNAIVNPAQGLMIYNTDLNCFNFYDQAKSTWVGIGCEAVPSTATGAIDCNNSVVQGTYRQGEALNSSNTITLTINFSTTGTYNISTTSNGMTFAGTGTVSTTGAQSIVLTGSGTPLAAGANAIPVSFNSSSCVVVVNVEDRVARLSSCPTAGTQSGSLVAGTAASGVTVPLTVTYTGGGLFTLNTSATNGISIASPTSGTLAASPAALSLTISGTPLLPGTTTLSYSLNSQTGCSIAVPVTTGTGRASAVACTGTLSGTYAVGTALVASNTKVVTLTVSTAGTFYLRTPTVNGIYFQAGPVSLAAGSQNVTLLGVGTPTAAGTSTYTVTASSSATAFTSCTFDVLTSSTSTVPNFTTIPCGTPGAAYSFIKAPNPTGSDLFGYSTAVSGNGLTMAVGSPFEDGSGTGINPASNDAGIDVGAVYIYTRATTASSWNLSAYIKASNAQNNDRFGYSVSLSADGNTLAVGATGRDGLSSGVNPAVDAGFSNFDAGAVYVFTRSTVWAQQAFIKSGNPSMGDIFGHSVSLSADGNTLAVGALYEDGGNSGINPAVNEVGTNTGAAYVFTRSGTTWSQQAYVKASNPTGDDQFGFSVAVSGDGNTLAVGAIFEDGGSAGINQPVNEIGTNSGAAYVFTRSGTTWSQQAYIKSFQPTGDDNFGWSVALNTDGNTLAVGAWLEDGGNAGINQPVNEISPNSGAAYVFTRSGTTWSQQAYVKSSNPTGADNFGFAVALSGDGNTLAVGAPYEDGINGCINGANNNSLTNSGAAYVYIRSGTSWVEQAIVKTQNPQSNTDFGRAVSLSTDGKVLAVGAPYEDSAATGINPAQNTSGTDTGAAFVYTGN